MPPSSVPQPLVESDPQSRERSTDVIVIGCGASGIAAALQLQSSDFSWLLFEQRSRPGGVWQSEEPPEASITFDGSGQATVNALSGADPSPMYEDLTTNVPSDLMAYRDRPFEDSVGSYPRREAVESYLLRAARDIPENHLRFNCTVSNTRYSGKTGASSRSRRWEMEVDTPDGKYMYYSDHVIAANGHYSRPYIPWIDGLWTWPGKLMHAQYYRRPSDFDGQVVAVVGVGPSGYDIARQLALRREATGATENIYSAASHPPIIGIDWKDRNAPAWAKRIAPIPRISRVVGRTIFLEDLSSLGDVDTIIWATGYQFKFPCDASRSPWKDHSLLRLPPPPTLSRTVHPSESCYPIMATGMQGGLEVLNLDDMQTFYLPDPTFAFLVLNYNVIPFPLAEHQARAIIGRWSGRYLVPLRPFEGLQGSRLSHKLIPPSEFELENRLLRSVGEGGQVAAFEGAWTDVPSWKYERRQAIKEARLRAVGY